MKFETVPQRGLDLRRNDVAALKPVSTVAAGVLLALAVATSPSARADEAADIAALRAQLAQLQSKLEALSTQQSGAASAKPQGDTAAAAAPAAGASSAPTFNAGPVKVTLGGFVEEMGIYRNKNEGADWASNWNSGIPLPNSHAYYLSETHLTARQSRVSALAQGPSDGGQSAEAYLEADFGGATGNGNYNQSTSFAPRMRQYFADYRNTDSQWQLLFGQAWSLVTQNKRGIEARQENVVLTIDGQYAPGFDWLRVPQIRLVKQWGDKFTFGVSAENPAAQVSATTTASGASNLYGTVLYNVAGASNAFVSGTNLTTDNVPDLVAKMAFDPGWGHYELLGTWRHFRSREYAAGETGNRTSTGTGIGASVLLPLAPKVLDFQASVLSGNGIGRYGSAGEPDVTVNPVTGELAPLHSLHALAGLVLRPNAQWTLYGYAGMERVDARAYTQTVGASTYGYGYGSPLFSNSGCFVEGSASTCVANTHNIESFTVGGWWKFYQGGMGNMQLGLSDSETHREVFNGVSGLAPFSSINMLMVSFRYYPYQK